MYQNINVFCTDTTQGTVPLEKLGQHSIGDLRIVRPDALIKFKADRDLLRTEQMSDPEILRTATKTMPSLQTVNS